MKNIRIQGSGFFYIELLEIYVFQQMNNKEYICFICEYNMNSFNKKMFRII